MKYAISASLFLVSAVVIIGVIFNWQASRPRESANELLGAFPNVVDGVFAGSEGYISLEVVVSSGKITEIRILKNRSDRYAIRAEETVDRILEAQSLDVDLVTGATATSESIVAAVENALDVASSVAKE
ncbi:MAG: FMN-binding protein [Kosmotogaceae bacterium]|nr:FMN-binding protein [Kosmotogaceae bacterium]